MRQVALGPDHTISRVIRGGWQLAGGHGTISRDAAVDDLIACADAGITTFDCADIYTGVEELLGAFRTRYARERGAEALSRIRIHTKYVPDFSALGGLTKADAEAAIARSAKRLGVERVDLVQFHWWDLDQPGWRDAAGWLSELRARGLIRNIGGTNFDSRSVAAMLEDGVPLVSMQVQYSPLDTRPARDMSGLGAQNGFQLLCYGSVAGGFLSDKWLGAAEPESPLENRSLTKYKLIIDDAGGWAAFQNLLRALRGVADRRECDIATVASAWTLAQEQVAAVIVGARNRAHLADNLAISSVHLTGGDLAEIDAARNELAPLDGDVYTLERDRGGRHGSIMKYELNESAA